MKKYIRYIILTLGLFLSFSITSHASTDSIYGFTGKYICFNGSTQLNSGTFETTAYDYGVLNGRNIAYRCNSGWTYIVFIINQFGLPVTYNEWANEVFSFDDSAIYYQGHDDTQKNKYCMTGSPKYVCPTTYYKHYGINGFSFVLYGDGDTNNRLLTNLHFATNSEISSLSSFQAQREYTTNSQNVINNNTNNAINNSTNSIINNQNNQFNQLQEKADEQNETSKGIWSSLKDGISSIGKWFTNLSNAIGQFFVEIFENIKGIFIPEPKCYDSPNLLDFTTNFRQSDGLSISVNEQKFIINGTPTRDNVSIVANVHIDDILLNSEEYVLSSTNNSLVYAEVAIRNNETGKTTYKRSSRKDSFIVDKTKNQYIMYVYTEKASATGTFENYEVGFQLEKGSVPTEWKATGQYCEETSFFTWFERLADIIKGFFEWLLTGILDGLKALFIPNDMEFITNFVDTIENKLGFIAQIPMSIISFLLGLANATWNEFNSIQIPSISIFGYYFWNSQDIDLTEAINIFKPFKYVTDVICVTLFCNTLLKWWEEFSGGGSK